MLDAMRYYAFLICVGLSLYWYRERNIQSAIVTSAYEGTPEFVAEAITNKSCSGVNLSRLDPDLHYTSWERFHSNVIDIYHPAPNAEPNRWMADLYFKDRTSVVLDEPDGMRHLVERVCFALKDGGAHLGVTTTKENLRN